KLTGRAVTDYSNASRTLAFDIQNLRWDGQLCEVLGIPIEALPGAAPSAQVYGQTRADAFFGAEVPVAGIAGDQQAALFGQACHRHVLGKNTYGTGNFVLLNIGGGAPPPSPGV